MMSSSVGDLAHAPHSQPVESWVDESLKRYTNPYSFGASREETAPTPELQEEISLSSPEGRAVNLQVSSRMG